MECKFVERGWFRCRLFELGNQEKDGASKLAISPSEKVISQLEGVGLQLALVFNLGGSLLAAGGEVNMVFKIENFSNYVRLCLS